LALADEICVIASPRSTKTDQQVVFGVATASHSPSRLETSFAHAFAFVATATATAFAFALAFALRPAFRASNRRLPRASRTRLADSPRGLAFACLDPPFGARFAVCACASYSPTQISLRFAQPTTTGACNLSSNFELKKEKLRIEIKTKVLKSRKRIKQSSSTNEEDSE